MEHWGKIAGGALGFMMGGPVGAALGAGMGAVLDGGHPEGDPNRAASEDPSTRDVTCPECRAAYRLPPGLWNCNACSTDFQVGFCTQCGSSWTWFGSYRCHCGALLGEEEAHTEAAPELSGEELVAHNLFVAPAIFGTLMAAADGRADEHEIHRIVQFYVPTDADTLATISGIIEEVLQGAIGNDVVELASGLAGDFAEYAEFGDCVTLTQMLYSVAMADRELHVVEAEVIRTCEVAFGISAEQSSYLKTVWVTGEFQGDREDLRTENEALSALGFSAAAPLADVKRRHRELVRKYHPDKFAQMGEEFVEIASVKFQQIQDAYERLSNPGSAAILCLCACHELLPLRRGSSVDCPECAVQFARAKDQSWILDCHFCTAKNRVPFDRASESPRCGQCKAILAFRRG